jgi:hypothetical protein
LVQIPIIHIGIDQRGEVCDGTTKLGRGPRIYGKSKNIKVPGSGVMPSRFLRTDVGEMLIILHQILIKAWEDESKPNDWKRSNMYPVFKTSDVFFVVIKHRQRF